MKVEISYVIFFLDYKRSF